MNEGTVLFPRLRPFLALATAELLLFTNACMIGPRYQRPAASAPPTFKESPPAGWKEAQPNDGALRGKWWEVYNDPRLNALEEQVSISNQNVLAAEAQFRAAREAVRVARAGLFPTLTTAPSASRSANGASPTVLHNYTLPADVSYLIDVWGTIRRGVAAGSATAQASAAQLENARLLYQADLATDYFQIQGLDASRQLLEATVKSYEQYVQLTQDRYDGGVASKADVALAQTQLETVRAQ
jgi:outer membrane protein TolC